MTRTMRRGRLGRYLRSGHLILFLGSLGIIAASTTAGFIIWHNYQATLEDHERSMNSMGGVLAEQTARFTQLIDLVLQEVASTVSKHASDVAHPLEEQLSAPDFRRYLIEQAKYVPQADAIGVIDNSGRMLNWSRPGPVPNLDFGNRDYFMHCRDHDDQHVVVGLLSETRSGRALNLFFARRINGPNGEFLGVMVAVAEIKPLIDFYQNIGGRLDEVVSLLRSDGTVLIRYPNPATAIGAKVPAGSPWFMRVASGGGSYVNPGNEIVESRLVSVHPLHDYPLVVDVSMKESIMFAGWRQSAIYIAGFGLVAALAFIGLIWMLARQFWRQAEQNTALEEAAIALQEGHQTLRAYAEMSVDWFWEQDANLCFAQKTLIPFASDGDDTGKTRWELAGLAMTEAQWAPHKADLYARRPFRNFRWERVDGDGRRRTMIISGDPIFDRHGHFTGYRGTGRDITAEIEATEELARANQELELKRQIFDAVLSNITQGISFFDSDRKLLLCNRRFNEIYSLPPEVTQIGSSLEEMLAARIIAGTQPKAGAVDYLAWREQIDADKQPATAVWPLEDGRFIAMTYQPLPGGGGVATHEDISERQQAEQNVVFMARHDALTRLPNRVLFRERLEQAIGMSSRGVNFAVMCLDLDKFKEVNDTLGHPVGDSLLVAVTERLQACARDVDTVARLGGDEFAIIQVGIRDSEDAAILANRIINAFRQPFPLVGHQVMSGVSIGVAVAGTSASYEGLMRDADIALYLAKTEGRGTARFFDAEMDARIRLRRTLELDLRGAIARQEFELYYQPQVNLVTNRISGFEALLRWNHPQRGMVSPLEFIPVAEDTGMIVAIGEWALRAACFEAENWPADIGIAVNLSPVQFKKGDLAATVQQALAASGLQPDRLELEITESVFLRDTAETLAALHQLRALGVSVALDDFGTGYSSLSYLRSFPFDKIKIDQSFVRDLMTNKESMSIVRAVTGLGQSLGMMIVAEGVETLEQLDTLRQEGCQKAQGYYFSRPRPAGDVSRLVEELQDIAEMTNSVASS